MVLENQLEMTIKAVFAALKDEHLPDIIRCLTVNTLVYENESLFNAPMFQLL